MRGHLLFHHRSMRNQPGTTRTINNTAAQAIATLRTLTMGRGTTTSNPSRSELPPASDQRRTTFS